MTLQSLNRERKATIVTGHIDHLTENGIKMKSGEHVDADFIISATGINLQHNFPFSTIKVSVDGEEYKAADHMIYNSVMLNNVPNFTFVVGYTNNAWTPKADLSAIFITKLMNYMRDNRIAKVVPRLSSDVKESNFRGGHFSGGLTSGYFARAANLMPKQGDRYPWRGGVNYIFDLISLAVGGLKRDSLEFTKIDRKSDWK